MHVFKDIYHLCGVVVDMLLTIVPKVPGSIPGYTLDISLGEQCPPRFYESIGQRSPAQCTLVQASLTRKHDRAIVAGSG